MNSLYQQLQSPAQLLARFMLLIKTLLLQIINYFITLFQKRIIPQLTPSMRNNFFL
ncbi:unnamed protein product [Meloidogyne enterolobii]|uniref:Uncharacterized protein n=1 Tax=Meloidogyne enterolobii TaxID=390850 RepID=A0ACB0YHA3_MELEN